MLREFKENEGGKLGVISITQHVRILFYLEAQFRRGTEQDFAPSLVGHW